MFVLSSHSGGQLALRVELSRLPWLCVSHLHHLCDIDICVTDYVERQQGGIRGSSWRKKMERRKLCNHNFKN